MSPQDAVDGPAARLAALRTAFDDAFAAPPPELRDDGVDVVVVRLGDRRVALRLAGLQGLHRAERLVPLPGAPAALRGLAGIHGRLVAVFDLAGLLGAAAGEAADGAWVALLAGQDGVGLAFDGVVGVRHVAREALLEAEGRAAGPLIGEAIAADEALGDEPGTTIGVLAADAVRAALDQAGTST